MVEGMQRHINLVTDVPGPRSRAIVARREAHVAAGLYKATPLAIAHAQGALVTDVDGNTYIDLVGGIGTLAVGHGHPAVVAAVQQQAAHLIHMSALVASYEAYVALCERLNTAVPISGPCKTLLGNSGAEAVEDAIKIARAYTGKSAIIVFDGAYHGRTLATISLTSRVAFKQKFGPYLPEVYRAPFPYAYRYGMDEAACVEYCWAALERMQVAVVDPASVAAVVIEPVQGEGGFIPVPAEFLRRLRDFCDTHGAVLIVDEVQSGFGRTGTLFAIEQAGVEPDILVSAKSLSAGMPLGATTGRAEIMDAAPLGGIGGTFGGNPLACVAALAVFDILEQERLLERATQIGAHIRERAAVWHHDLPMLGDVRGRGAMLALELVTDRASRTPAPIQMQAILERMLQHGVIGLRAGLYGNCIRLLAPLVITDDQLDESLNVLEDALYTLARP